MLRYIGKRLISMAITLWVVITITFFLMHSIPGDPFTNENREIQPEIMANLEAKYGLDKPLPQQYLIYLKKVVVDQDFGDSMKYRNRSVNEMIEQAWPASFTLGIWSALFGVLTGLTLGIIAALNHAKFFDYFVIFVAILGVSVPNFVFASLFQYVFAVQLGWFPVARWEGPEYIVLPALALGFRVIAFQARLMRTSLLDVLNQDYILTAKAKGLTRSSVIVKHGIRNAILPNITVLGPLLATLMTGTFVIEKIFGVPGLGKFFIQSIQQRDYPLIMGTTIFYAAVLIFMIFLVDILYGFIDPRIRLDK